MWWKRKVKLPTPEQPKTAEEMCKIAEESCEWITRVCFDDLLKLILKRSYAGHKSLSLDKRFFNNITIILKNGEKEWINPMVDFKLLKTLLTDREYNVVCSDTGEITSIFWNKTKNESES